MRQRSETLALSCLASKTDLPQVCRNSPSAFARPTKALCPAFCRMAVSPHASQQLSRMLALLRDTATGPVIYWSCSSSVCAEYKYAPYHCTKVSMTKARYSCRAVGLTSCNSGALRNACSAEGHCLRAAWFCLRATCAGGRVGRSSYCAISLTSCKSAALRNACSARDHCLRAEGYALVQNMKEAK